MIKHFAVIGNPIEHSLSPVIHQQFAQQTKINLTYEKIKGDDSIFEEQVSAFFNANGQGLNVTLPYKQRAFAMANVPTERCKSAGAANTLWMEENTLHADNTDGIGLVRDLARYMNLEGKRILILGAGGAVRGIINPLLAMQPDNLIIANRTVENARLLELDFPQIKSTSLDNLGGLFDLIINATSASLDGIRIELPEEVVSLKPFCYDLAYNQKEATPFVRYARQLGCESVDGLGMLIEQAAEAFKIWNGIMPTTDTVINAIQKMQ